MCSGCWDNVTIRARRDFCIRWYSTYYDIATLIVIVTQLHAYYKDGGETDLDLGNYER